LGEIEAVLNQHEEVKESVVVLSGGGVGGGVGEEKRLVGYVGTKAIGGGEARGQVRGEELREYVKGRLPEYMVPSVVVVLEKLPLTPNGKVDRKALPAPEWREREAEYIEPRSETEKILCGLWGEVLGVERVGVKGNFFELGGHSLLATQLVSRIRQVFALDLPLRTLFEAPTVEGLIDKMYEFYLELPNQSPFVTSAAIEENSSIEQMLASLETLTDEQVQALLTLDEEEA
jgi:acyl carrier protein